MACFNGYANELYVAGGDWLFSSSIGVKRHIFITGQSIPFTTEKKLRKIICVRAPEHLTCRKIGIKKLRQHSIFTKKKIIRINAKKKRYSLQNIYNKPSCEILDLNTLSQ